MSKDVISLKPISGLQCTHNGNLGTVPVPVEVHDVAAGDADDVGLGAVPGHRIVVLEVCFCCCVEVVEVVTRDVHGPRRHRFQVLRGDGLELNFTNDNRMARVSGIT